MKLRLLVIATVLCSISCNNDDNNPITSPEKNLKSVTVFNNDGDSNIDEKTMFENNRPVDKYAYNAQGQVTSREEFTYNSLGY